MHGVLVDAGPLEALIDRRDTHHGRCVEALRGIADPLVTAWPALVEAMYLLDTWPEQAALWAMVEAGPIALAPLDADDVPALRELMARYRDLPLDLADAALDAGTGGPAGRREIAPQALTGAPPRTGLRGPGAYARLRVSVVVTPPCGV